MKKPRKHAHRNSQENKLQLLRKVYFPQMRSKIEKIVKQCSICKLHKYDRQPNKPKIQETPIPHFPGQIVHLDLYYTNKKVLLTAIDKFSKYAIVRILKSRAVEDIKKPLRETILAFGVPNTVIFDNEKSFNSNVITFMLENKFGIKIFKAPPYSSTSNGQIERFHSTFSEILRCVQAERTHDTFEELIDLATFKYNHSIHSTIKQKPVETFFGRTVSSDPQQIVNERIETTKRLQEKQKKDLDFHNKNRKDLKNYQIGDTIYVRINKRIGNKLSPKFRKEIVAENQNSTIVTMSGKVIHKSLIRN